ncbi:MULTISPECIES: TonB-dependent receptor [unclassified Pseudodesulfovibrio]|uniref:TonB-dependent receptor n=1 Tax=unclassified Pseudodesulfovibrio TaxID=2661612 RepID=UPI0013E2D6CE|nr:MULTISPECIES: TonB-dependent receptor [unclassified Pseudodesulfovibrio]MCJ2163402.1 TonB-dependent receptor [Pseudodesulfovibrio sp. S3-i]
MKRRLYPVLLTAFLITLFAGWAEAKEITLDKVIVSARGEESTQSQTPGGTGVVEKEEIVLVPTASLADSLSRISGLTKTGESPWGQDVSIRGMTGASVVVLIDGMRLNTATEINARLGFINPLDVERIEVLKGPVSSLYGSGSTGGVINVITKKGSFSAEPELGGEFIGSWRTNPQGPDGYLRANLSKEDLWLQLSGGLRDHGDLWGGDDTRISNSQYEDTYFRLAGEKAWGERLTTRFQAMNLEGNEIGIPGGSSTMPANADITYPRTKNTLISLDTNYAPDSDTFKAVELNIYYMKNDRRVRIDNPNALVSAIKPSAEHETVGGKLQTKFDLGEHSIVAGADAYNWHMISKRVRYMVAGTTVTDNPTPNTTQLSMGIFAEDDWKLTDQFTLNMGARLDHNDIDNQKNSYVDAGSSKELGWNLHTGLTWRPAEHWSHTLIAASSYRAADIIERFKYINLGGGVTSVGNPDLDPETSYYAEYGLHYTTPTFSASGAAYINYITDYIDEKLLNPTTYQMENIGEARIYGLELDADWKFLPQWTVYGNLALANGQDMQDDEALRNVAPASGMTGLRYDQGNGFWARLESPWALRQSEVPSGADRTNGWITFNAATGYGFEWGKTRNEISLAVDNIFDTKYQNYLANSRGIDLLESGLSAALTYQVTF